MTEMAAGPTPAQWQEIRAWAAAGQPHPDPAVQDAVVTYRQHQVDLVLARVARISPTSVAAILLLPVVLGTLWTGAYLVAGVATLALLALAAFGLVRTTARLISLTRVRCLSPVAAPNVLAVAVRPRSPSTLTLTLRPEQSRQARSSLILMAATAVGGTAAVIVAITTMGRYALPLLILLPLILVLLVFGAVALSVSRDMLRRSRDGVALVDATGVHIAPLDLHLAWAEIERVDVDGTGTGWLGVGLHLHDVSAVRARMPRGGVRAWVVRQTLPVRGSVAVLPEGLFAQPLADAVAAAVAHHRAALDVAGNP